MKSLILLLLALLPTALFAQNKFVLVIHGGAGTIQRSAMTPAKEAAYRAGLQQALDTGSAILRRGGPAVDAVEAAVRVLEDNPLFNAGKGAVFTADGRNELDAAIMDGSTLKAGSVAGLTTIRHPVSAARAVMDKSNHVMLAGRGADSFAAAAGCEVVRPSYFYTEERWQGLLRARAADSLQDIRKDTLRKSYLRQPEQRDDKYGTVGAVALDIHGNLAAATSTGGMTNKRFGRIGDSPLIGAGTYANNQSCAVSCTGWGEYFIRLVLAKAVSDRVALAHQTLQEAADELIRRQLPALGGDGGLIAVDRDGNFVMPFNTPGMYRAYITSEGKTGVLMYTE